MKQHAEVAASHEASKFYCLGISLSSSLNYRNRRHARSVTARESGYKISRNAREALHHVAIIRAQRQAV